jgi:N-acetylmuramoyl-L-alanine amidase
MAWEHEIEDKLKRLIIWILVGSVAFGALSVSAQQTGKTHALDTEFVVNGDGLVVEIQAGSPQRMSGPAIPGEVRFSGGFLPEVLSSRQQRQLHGLFSGSRSKMPAATKERLQTDKLIVVIDAGHGGKQIGATGTTGLKEKDLVLDVAKVVRQVLSKVDGLEVVMIRQTDRDIPLWDRVAIANQVGADLFISIHANAFSSSSLAGVETFFHSIEASGEEAKRVAKAENASGGVETKVAPDTLSFILQDMQLAERLRDSSRLAHLVQEQLAKELPLENRGVMQADFIVLRSTRMASVLVELGFLTNPRDEKILKAKNNHKKIARAIKNGVLAYWDLIKLKQGRKRGGVGAK